MVLWESVGQLLGNISLFGGGIAFALLSLVLGITRGMTKNADTWALLFSALTWTIALVVPSATFAATIFAAGAIAITFAYQPLIKNLSESNIYMVAMIALIINVSIVLGAGAFGESLNWGTNLAEQQASIDKFFQSASGSIDLEEPGHGLCIPSQEKAGLCTRETDFGSFNPLIFDVFASVLAISDYIGKGIKFAGMAVFAPFVISGKVAALVTNGFVGYLIGLYASLWNLIILYQVIKVILARRGLQ